MLITRDDDDDDDDVSIPPWVVTSEAVVAQVTSLLFDMGQKTYQYDHVMWHMNDLSTLPIKP